MVCQKKAWPKFTLSVRQGMTNKKNIQFTNIRFFANLCFIFQRKWVLGVREYVFGSFISAAVGFWNLEKTPIKIGSVGE